MVDLSRIGETFAGEITGVSIAAGVSDDEIAQIDRAIREFPVLCIRNQPIDDDAQLVFVNLLGPPLVNDYTGIKGRESGKANFIDVTTVDSEGRKLEEGSEYDLVQKANLLWHTDGAFFERRPRLTVLSARTLPKVPPPTLFADMRAAWDALPDERQREIETMQVEYSMLYSREKAGVPAGSFSEDFQNQFPAVQHPLVRFNAATGRRSLFLSSHASHIVGMPVEKGRALLEELTAHATQPRFQYGHEWRPHDLLIWDNTCTMHRAVPYDGAEPRALRWTGVFERETA